MGEIQFYTHVKQQKNYHLLMCKWVYVTYVNYFPESTHEPITLSVSREHILYIERDEDKAERSFKISKSVSAAYRAACPRIDLLESREKQTVKMLTFVFLSLPFKILKKKSLGSEGILNFKESFSISLVPCWYQRGS
jgi:hypothetical protein